MKAYLCLSVLLVAVYVNGVSAECSKAMCRMHCEFGFQRDENDCMFCKCNSGPPDCSGSPMCAMYCEYGFQTGLDGCPVCTCNETKPDCSNRAMCDMYCENGFLNGLDGCPVCKCA